MTTQQRPRGSNNPAPAPAADAAVAPSPTADAVDETAAIMAMMSNPAIMQALMPMILASISPPANAGSSSNILANAGNGNNVNGANMSSTPAPIAPLAFDPNALRAMLSDEMERASARAVDAMFSDESVSRLAEKMQQQAKDSRPFYKDPLVLGVAGLAVAAGVGYVMYRTNVKANTALALGTANATAINALGISQGADGSIKLLNVK